MAMAFLSTQNEIIILPTSVKNGKVPITVTFKRLQTGHHSTNINQPSTFSSYHSNEFPKNFLIFMSFHFIVVLNLRSRSLSSDRMARFDQ